MKRHNLAIALSALLVSGTASAELFLSEHIEGSSNNKALEIFNPGDTAVDLSTYTIEFYSNGNTTPNSSVIQLTGTLEAKGIYVIANSSAAAELLALADQTGAVYINGNDAIVFKNGETVIDSMGQVGVDEYWESDGVSMSNSTIRRKSTVTAGDTDTSDAYLPGAEWNTFAIDDFSDLGMHNGFGTAPDPTPDPEPTPEIGACTDPATMIHEVQGNTVVEDGGASPLLGNVVTLEAVVTGTFFDGAKPLAGFFIQEEDADQDADPNSSEGLFVYFPEGTPPTVGQQIRIQGEVAEYYNGTQLSNVTAVVVCAEGQTVTPAALELPLTSRDQFEAYEGMLVASANPLVVTGTDTLDQYGEFWVADERIMSPTEIHAPGDEANAYAALKDARQFLIDDVQGGAGPAYVPFPAGGLSAQNSLRLGTEITNAEGIIYYSFNEYRLAPTVDLQFVDTNPRTAQPDVAGQGDVRVALMNVLNLFNGDGQGGGFPTERGADNIMEFERQLPKVVSAIVALNADVVGLVEVENDGNGENGMLAQLVAALNAEGSGEWAFANVGGSGLVGTDAITNAIIYRSDRVAETGTAVFTTADPFDYGNRPPVAQTFKDLVNEDEFTFVVTHLRSKGSCGGATGGDADANDGQGCWNATRVAAVQQLQQWLAGDPTGRIVADVLVMGDMNAYSMEDPIAEMVAGGYTNLKADFANGATTHTYVYQNESGSLDHAFASAELTAKVVAAQAWHINADEPEALDYNTEYKSTELQATYYAEDQYRSSDHDPVIVAFTTEANDPTDEGSGDTDGDAPTEEEEHVNIDHASTSSSFPLWLVLSGLFLGLVRRRV
jgi:hypothetical protein